MLPSRDIIAQRKIASKLSKFLSLLVKCPSRYTEKEPGKPLLPNVISTTVGVSRFG